MRTRVVWTEKEERALAERCLVLLERFHSVSLSASITQGTLKSIRGFFEDVFSNAQKSELGFPRIRKVASFSQVPWLVGALEEARKKVLEERAASTPKEEEEVPKKEESGELSVNEIFGQGMAAFADLVAEKVLSKLEEKYDLHRLARYVTPKALHQEVALAVKSKKPKVLVFGLLKGPETQNVEKAWGEKFELIFREAHKSLSRTLPQADFCVMQTSFANHSQDKKLKQVFGSDYVRVTGGAEAVIRSINKISTKLGL